MEVTAWTQLLAFGGHAARRWEPKRLRHRLFSLPAQLVRHARQTVLNLPAHRPWTGSPSPVQPGSERSPSPADPDPTRPDDRR